MTTPTMNAPAGQAPGPRPVPWFRLARVTLRQRRGLFTGLGVLLGLFAAYLTTVAIIQGNAYATVAACHPSGLAALSSAQAGLLQPNSRFWQFQLIEGGWLLALSAALIGATIWLLRRRGA
jgi:hypothetical protein